MTDDTRTKLEDAPGAPFDAVAYKAMLERRINELRSGTVEGVTHEALRAVWQPSR